MYFESAFQRLKVCDLFIRWIGVLLIIPKTILGLMSLSSLLLLVFEAVFQVVEAYSTTGLTAPV